MEMGTCGASVKILDKVGRLGRKEIQKGGDVCVCMADSLCCTAETNIVKQLFSNKIFRKEEMSYGHEKIGK